MVSPTGTFFGPIGLSDLRCLPLAAETGAKQTSRDTLHRVLRQRVTSLERVLFSSSLFETEKK